MDDKTATITPEEDAVSGLESINLIEDTLDKFIATADVEKVYGKPIKNGDTLIVPTAEILCGMGFGVGSGSGDQMDEGVGNRGEGGGGGGGGRVLSRPVAVIIASPEGVRVEPVIDPTKIALAALTAAGFMFSMLFRMMRGPRNLT
jgi:uncharacterized spore protein YtfJ